MTQNVDKNAEVVIDYIERYVEKKAHCYELLTKMVEMPKLENEFSDTQWAYIIDQAWQLAYAKAMEDAYLSPEEKEELNNINELSIYYKNQPKDRKDLNYKIYHSYKKIAVANKINDKAVAYDDPAADSNPYKPATPYPTVMKPTPYDNYNKKKE